MDERSPLIIYPLNTEEPTSNGTPRRDSAPRSGTRKLSTFLGVVVPTLLAMFSVVLFLRIGFVVGQSGLYESVGMLILSYFIIGMTVLSVCAISTNGALDAGGAYYMISRALGPEFGGSIGIMFFFANVCGSALYILGLVENIVSMFGISTGQEKSGVHVLPQSYWYEYIYGTVLLLICLVVCLVGASIYAKATFLIFIVVMVVLTVVFISFFAVKEKIVTINITDGNITHVLNGTFTGFKLSTLKDNVYPHYAQDYTTGKMMSFATVFAVMFNGCTGIMAGSNMSGDLKNPSYSIPRGTITAVIFTYIIYNLLVLMISCTCDRMRRRRQMEEEERSSSRRRFWIHPIVSQRPTLGYFQSMYVHLRMHPEKFHNFTRMSVPVFDDLLEMLRPRLQRMDTMMRSSVSPEERLLVTLRFLATGLSFVSLHHHFLLGVSTVAQIVRESCVAIWEELNHIVMPEPTDDLWKAVVAEFWEKTQFPNCLGALDGKHTRVKKPPHSGSSYYNYKKYFSVVLLAVADANLRFIAVDVGAYGSQSDARIFRESVFGRRLHEGRLNIPENRPLPGTEEPSLPLVMIADEAFGLSEHILRPYSGNFLSDEKKIF